ncbi:hypothetical protein [Nocardia sp. NPDC127526]|uniref:IS1096 element passenger TnpR family protein n=1 Tax=Nocardia sp. NPDC127526 TaxID=3345393 RepID=UPI0036268E06
MATATYRVRVESVRPNGRIWRGLEVASDLYLDEVHEVLQAAYGWKDKQRYRFGSAAGFGDRETEHYLCPLESGQWRQGVPQDEVRLDELLVEPGDELFHRFDAGQGWQRVVRLEEVREFGENSPRAVCFGGTRDLDAVDLALSVFGRGVADESAIDCAELPDVFGRIIVPRASGRTRRELRHLLGQAMIDLPVRIDAKTAAAIVRPYSCLLEHIGIDGVGLNEWGELPPATAMAIFAEAAMSERWIRRRSEPTPIAELRRTAYQFGLTRQEGRRLRLSDAGLQALVDPVLLWWHIAEYVPRTAQKPVDRDVAALYVLAAATDTDDPAGTAAPLLDGMGRRLGERTVSTGRDVAGMIFETLRIFKCLGMTPRDRFSYYRIRHHATRMFARAVLQRWPRSDLWPRPET